MTIREMHEHLTPESKKKADALIRRYPDEYKQIIRFFWSEDEIARDRAHGRFVIP